LQGGFDRTAGVLQGFIRFLRVVLAKGVCLFQLDGDGCQMVAEAVVNIAGQPVAFFQSGQFGYLAGVGL
jgi:hypothetical protein